MHRNTFLLVTVLAIIASLLVGFNVGKKYTEPNTEVLVLTPTASNAASPTAKPTPLPLTQYTNRYCRISLSYPASMTVTEPATGSAKFAGGDDTVILVCQHDIPGIAVEYKNMETITIGSTSGTLYHTATPKDGTAIDVLKITHPKTGMDVLVSGIGMAFDAMIASLTLNP